MKEYGPRGEEADHTLVNEMNKGKRENGWRGGKMQQKAGGGGGGGDGTFASEPKGQKQQPLPDVMVISKFMQK